MRRYRAIVSVLFRSTDVLIVCAAWLASYGLRLLSGRLGHEELPQFATYASLVPFILWLWASVFSVSGVYHSGRMRSMSDEVTQLWRAHAAALVVAMALAYLFAYRYSRLVTIYFAVVAAASLAVFRILLRGVLRALRRRGYDVRGVIVVGSGETVRTLIERFAGYPELGMAVTGLVTRDGAAPEWASEVPVLGRFPEIGAIIEAHRPSEVLVALAASEYTELNALLEDLREAPAAIRVIPDIRPHVRLSCHVEHFEDLPVIRLNDPPLESWHSLAKRSIDAGLSAVGLVVLSPLLVLIGLIVKLTSPGPVLYAQERMGKGGLTFHMYKFRSMRVDAEKSGAGWSTKGDPRCTPLGAFLRKTSLDELPQLWNVLVGHMSLVGPRPERPMYVERFRRTIPDYMLRHKVKSGITGWAQVNGWRGDTSLTERTACDLYYIRNWSLQLDLKILMLTFWKGFVNKNAY